jgi:hypothetical protein
MIKQTFPSPTHPNHLSLIKKSLIPYQPIHYLNPKNSTRSLLHDKKLHWINLDIRGLKSTIKC